MRFPPTLKSTVQVPVSLFHWGCQASFFPKQLLSLHRLAGKLGRYRQRRNSRELFHSPRTTPSDARALLHLLEVKSFFTGTYWLAWQNDPPKKTGQVCRGKSEAEDSCSIGAPIGSLVKMHRFLSPAGLVGPVWRKLRKLGISEPGARLLSLLKR